MKHLQSNLAPLFAALVTQTVASAQCEWQRVDVPFNSAWKRAEFRDVSTAPDGTTWAVGYAQLPSPPNGPEEVTLAMRYSNGQWQHTPTPYVAPGPGLAADFLHAVDAFAPNDVWAAGERYGDAGGLSVGAWLHVLHWDGASWSEMPVPAPPGGVGINFSGTRVYDIAALAANDVWFAGLWGEPNASFAVTWRPLAMHWDGSGFTVHDTPVLFSGTNPMHLRQIAAVSPTDIWGICWSNTAGGATNSPTILRYNGSTWNQVSAPSLGGQVVLDDVTVASANEVWFFGHTYPVPTPFALKWNGSSFSVVNGVPQVSSASAEGPGQVHLGRFDLQLFDGVSSSVTQSFTGLNSAFVLGMETAPACEGWAVGRYWGAPGGDFAPLAFRRAPNVCAVSNYCTAKVNSLGCTPAITTSGSTSPNSPAPFVVSANSVISFRFGLFFYGLSGRESAPFKGGHLCVKLPLRRTPVQSSNGNATGDCSGVYTFDFSAWRASGADSGLTTGATVNGQFWSRDPGHVDGTGTGLTGGIEFELCP